MEEILQDKYRILHEVGRGGMAVVYKGLDLSLEREVAIKVLHPHLADRSDSRVRFQREAKAVAKLHHLNILEIYDYSGIDSEQSYIVTEYIRGETLKDFLDRVTIKLPEIGALITIPVASALAHAHDTGVIHRDIKPENIMIRDDGVIKLMDFGIARMIDTYNMTVTGALVGSPAHMAPEHVEGRHIDNRADVFSTGTLIYLLCTGSLPFDSMSAHALLRQIMEVRYEDPRRVNPAIGRRLHSIISRCLKYEPDERYSTAHELEKDLRNYVFELGFEDTEKELATYFEDPAEHEEIMTRQVVDCLMKTAQHDAESGKVASALEAYNQVLALQGDRKDALVQVQRLSTAKSRGDMLRKVGLAAAATLLMALVVWSFSLQSLLSAKQPVAVEHAVSPEALISILQNSSRARLNAPVAGRDATITGIAGKRRNLELYAHSGPQTKLRRLQARSRLINHNAMVVGRPKTNGGNGGLKGIAFRIKTFPFAAEINFEGVVYTGATGPLVRKPGTYRVRIHHPDCDQCVDKNYKIQINKKTPRDGMTLPVGFKPATLVVRTVQSATIQAAGRTARPNQPISFKMRDLKTKVNLIVTAPGHKETRRKVTIHANRTTVVPIQLSKVSSK